MDEYELSAKYNIAETCCASVSVEHLLSLGSSSSGPTISALDLFSPSTPQTYGEIRGSTALKTNLANIYNEGAENPLLADNILINPGAIASNFLVLYALVGPGDHVICQHPTYQQLYSVPRSLGAEVSLWEMHEERDWQLDIDELKSLIQPNTKLIVIKYALSSFPPKEIEILTRLSNPNNPTGAVLPKSLLTTLITIASTHNPPITILSDEVYRPLFHSPSSHGFSPPPSILNAHSTYPHLIATGSLSKAYSLAGIRIGWLATRSRPLLELCAAARDYTNISVSIADQAVAAYALSPSCLPSLLDRNIKLAAGNLQILSSYVERWLALGWAQWTRPVAGTTAFVKFMREGKAVQAVEFCKRLQAETGVMVLPGDRGFGDQSDGGKRYEGYVRIGYVPERKVLEGGLKVCHAWMEREWESLPLVEA